MLSNLTGFGKSDMLIAGLNISVLETLAEGSSVHAFTLLLGLVAY